MDIFIRVGRAIMRHLPTASKLLNIPSSFVAQRSITTLYIRVNLPLD